MSVPRKQSKPGKLPYAPPVCGLSNPNQSSTLTRRRQALLERDDCIREIVSACCHFPGMQRISSLRTIRYSCQFLFGDDCLVKDLNYAIKVGNQGSGSGRVRLKMTLMFHCGCFKRSDLAHERVTRASHRSLRKKPARANGLDSGGLLIVIGPGFAANRF